MIAGMMEIGKGENKNETEEEGKIIGIVRNEGRKIEKGGEMEVTRRNNRKPNEVVNIFYRN